MLIKYTARRCLSMGVRSLGGAERSYTDYAKQYMHHTPDGFLFTQKGFSGGTDGVDKTESDWMAAKNANYSKLQGIEHKYTRLISIHRSTV